MLKNNSKGIYLALFTAFISGFSIFINKFAVGAISPPLVFTATKNFGVGLILLSILLLTGKWKKIKELRKKEAIYLLLIGIIGGALPFYLFFTGISMIPAINAALIHKTLVLWVAILALPLLKEKLTKLQLLAIFIMFSSNLFIGGFTGMTFSKGEFFVLVATILWAIENVIAKKVLTSVDPDLVTGARMGFGSLILMGASIVIAPQGLLGIFNLNITQWFWMTVTAVALFGYVSSWYRALKVAPATTVATVLVASTLVTNVLSALFITHTWNVTLLPQAGLIVSGMLIFFGSLKRTESLKAKVV